MRPLWTGSIGFGLVNIPVKLYSATQASELDLDMLDSKDRARIRFQRVNEDTGKEVPWERIVRAYDLNGRYVVLEDADLKSAAVEKSDVIAIHDFVDEAEVEGKYYEKPYYLEPAKGGTRAYALLREALVKSGKVGVASFVMRTKEHAGVLQPDGPVLILNQLRFAEEIRPLDGLKLPKEKIPPAELKLALQLIDQGSGRFDISQYKDEYTEALLKVIKAKARSKGARKATPMKVVHRKAPDDLMASLKASLGRQRKKTARKSTPKSAPKKKATSTRTRKALLDAGALVHVVSLKSGTIKGWKNGDWKGSAEVDRTLDQARPEDYDALVLPGGVINPDKLRKEAKAVAFVRSFFADHKPVAAICHGPGLLAEADVLEGRKVTSYSSIRTDLKNAGAEWVDEEVVVDEGLVTSRSPEDLPAFNTKLVEEVAEGAHSRQRT